MLTVTWWGVQAVPADGEEILSVTLKAVLPPFELFSQLHELTVQGGKYSLIC